MRDGLALFSDIQFGRKILPLYCTQRKMILPRAYIRVKVRLFLLVYNL